MRNYEIPYLRNDRNWQEYLKKLRLLHRNVNPLFMTQHLLKFIDN